MSLTCSPPLIKVIMHTYSPAVASVSCMYMYLETVSVTSLKILFVLSGQLHKPCDECWWMENVCLLIAPHALTGVTVINDQLSRGVVDLWP